MKISYIIMPFENPEYLVRCVNSLYRQLGNDYEVILGENFFRNTALEKNSEKAAKDNFGELRDFLESKEELIGISPYAESREEKLKEAFSLVSEDSDYVMMIDVNTVVSPVAAQAILNSGGGELMIPAAAVREGDVFVIDALKEKDILKNPDKIPPQRFCYGRKLFERIETKFFEIQEPFSVFITTLFTEEIKITTIDEICIYSLPFSVPKQEEQEFETVRENSFAILDRLFKIKDTEVQILIFARMLRQLFTFLDSAEYEIREATLSALKVIGNAAKDRLLFRKFFEGQIGFDIQDFLSLDYGEYKVYKDYIVSKKAGPDTADMDAQEKMIKDLGDAVAAVREEMNALRKDIAGFAQTQNQAVAAVIGVRQDYTNPALDIPQMYREGRLGLRTIIRSFSGWLKYKFSGKKG